MMCEEQHKLHPSHQLFFPTKSLRDIDIPPRKLLSRTHRHVTNDEEALFRKFLPCNNDDEEDDPYASEQFRMYEFKVRRCTRSRSHDWTDCPFAHPGEKARRRDPRRYHYSGTVCPEFRRGSCSKGDNCEFAHGVFECWLHPARYRTEACKDGKNCKRKVCFFAHTPRQLRLLPSSDSPKSPSLEDQKFLNSMNNHCCSCIYCHHHMSASPTSTLHFSPPLSPSPSLSPPLSPATSYSPVSRFSKFGGLSYKEALTELMSSIEGLNVNEGHNMMAGNMGYNRSNLSWVDVNNFNGGDDQSQFAMSPSSSFGARGGVVVEESRVGESGLNYPDFGWVNDLLT